MLAQHFGRCREVEKYLGAVHCLMQRRGGRNPHILADFHAELHASDVEKHVAAEVGILAAHPDRGQADLFARHEAAGLVKFRVIGNICLGDHAVNTSLSENYRAVVEGIAVSDGHTDDGDDGQFAGLGEDIAQGLFRRMEQGGLLDQIAAGIGGDAEFREEDDACSPVGALADQFGDMLGVIVAIGDPYKGNCRRYFQKTKSVHTIFAGLFFSFSVPKRIEHLRTVRVSEKLSVCFFAFFRSA